MKVIIINGMAASGKSSFVALAKEVYPYTYELSIIDKVKEIAKLIGWDGQKDEKSRRFLADLKDAIERYDKDIIYSAIGEQIYLNSIGVDKVFWGELGCTDESVFFINARSPEDIEYLKNKYNAVTLFITNPRVPNITSNHADGHVNEYTYDYTIINDGTMEEYAEKAKKFMEMILNADQRI